MSKELLCKYMCYNLILFMPFKQLWYLLEGFFFSKFYLCQHPDVKHRES